MRKLALVALVLLGLLVVADLVARNVAESKLADHIDAQEGVQGTEVDIHGFSFLTQLVSSEFAEVDVTFPALSTDPGSGQDLQVHDVRLTLYDVETSETFTRAVASRVEGTGTVSYEQLSELLGVELRFDPASAGLRLSIPGRRISTVVQPSVDSSQGFVLGDVPAAFARMLRSDGFGFTGVPDEVSVTAVKPSETGLRVSLEAQDVPFAR